MEYPNKRDVQERAAAGQPISQEEVSSLEREERDMTGWGPVPGGTAGMFPNLNLSPRRLYNRGLTTRQRPPRAYVTGR